MGTKITASKERLFRLRMAALNDTMCLLRAFVSFKGLSSVLVAPGTFYLSMFGQHFLQGL